MPNAKQRLIPFLPKGIRDPLCRSSLKLSLRCPDGLEIKIARTRHELEACFRLLHDSYVEQGYMAPQNHGIRVTPYHALPTTTTFIATSYGKVIGTLTLIRDGVFGLPLEKAYDLMVLRRKKKVLAEVSSLAVHKEFRGEGGAYVFPLLKYMYEYATRYFGTEILVIGVNPRQWMFYESILLFSPIHGVVDVQNYDFVSGAPVIGACLDLRWARKQYDACYGDRSDEQNLFKYFTRVTLPNLKFPKRRHFRACDPIMTPELFNYFFIEKTKELCRLNEEQLRLLGESYPTPEYEKVLSLQFASLRRRVRKPRHPVFCHAAVITHDSVWKGTVLSVSDEGFMVRPANASPMARVNQELRAFIYVAENLIIEMTGRIVWIGENGIGVHCQRRSSEWFQFVQEVGAT